MGELTLDEEGGGGRRPLPPGCEIRDHGKFVFIKIPHQNRVDITCVCV